jgi:hypothetical protein
MVTVLVSTAYTMWYRQDGQRNSYLKASAVTVMGARKQIVIFGTVRNADGL